MTELLDELNKNNIDNEKYNNIKDLLRYKKNQLTIIRNTYNEVKKLEIDRNELKISKIRQKSSTINPKINLDIELKKNSDDSKNKYKSLEKKIKIID